MYFMSCSVFDGKKSDITPTNVCKILSFGNYICQSSCLVLQKYRCNISHFFRCLGTDINNMSILDDLFSISFHFIFLKLGNFMRNDPFPHF